MARRKQFALSKQRKLLDQAKEVAVKAGAVPTPDSLYQFQMATTVGLLRLSFSDGHALASVFGRFDEPDRAVALFGAHAMNCHSGKWNHHVSSRDDLELFLLSFKADLAHLTAELPRT